LVFYYNSYHFVYLHLMGDETGRKLLQIIVCDKYEMIEILDEPIDVTSVKRVYLKGVFDYADIQFYYATKEDDWLKVGDVLDGSILSDDYVRDEANRYRPAFTGAFVGLCCQDLTGEGLHADFDWWEYQEG